MLRRRIVKSATNQVFVLTAPEPVIPSRGAKQSPLHVAEGLVRLHPHGFGFINCPDGSSFYVRAGLAQSLLSGDTVRFSYADGDDHAASEVLEIRRDATRLLCELKEIDGHRVLASDETVHQPIEAPETTLADFAVGDILVTEAPAYTGAPEKGLLCVKVLSSLGPRRLDIDFAVSYAQAQYDFEQPLPTAALEEARAHTLPTEAADAHPYVTIDSAESNDLDDAVFAQELPNGQWEVRIAIADVSWYVRPGSVLDTWAAQRCTTVYLPSRVLPMLPESLSTSCCSIHEGSCKRAVVLAMRLDAQGVVRASEVMRTTIRSAARLSYTQAAAFMDGGREGFPKEVCENLTALTNLYTVLAHRRDGSARLRFESPDPVLVPQDDGGVSLGWEHRTEAHKLVEELMLLANQTAAEHLLARYGAGVFRHQPPPTREAWNELRDWAAGLPDRFDLAEEPQLSAMSDLVAAQGSEAKQLAAEMRVRSAMRPANYVVQSRACLDGHFSLDMPSYTHFTSPIRRYADILVHRLLLAPAGFTPMPTYWDTLAEAVRQCSKRSHAARLAERSVWDHLKLRQYEKSRPETRIGLARVLRCSERGGLRVLLEDWQCAATIPAKTLVAGGGTWVNAEATWSIAGGRLTTGSRIQVRGASIDRTRPAYPDIVVDLAGLA